MLRSVERCHRAAQPAGGQLPVDHGAVPEDPQRISQPQPALEAVATQPVAPLAGAVARLEEPSRAGDREVKRSNADVARS